MPGKMLASSAWRKRAMRLSRSSSFTRRVRRRSSEKALRRNSPSVRGRLMREPPGKNTFLDYTRKCGLRASALGLRQKLSMQTVTWFAEARRPKADARLSVDVAVAPSLFPAPGGAMEIRNNTFEISDE